MDKSLKPITKNHLIEVEAPVRAELLKELPKEKRKQAVANLIEAAMTLGLTDSYDIRRWLGLDNYSINTITAVRDKVKQKWTDEMDVGLIEYAKTQRAMQISKAWEEVRKCEEIYSEATTTNDKVKVKQLQLQWMQYVSKLSFVEKMMEDNEAPVSINLIPGSHVAIEGKHSEEAEVIRSGK